MITEDFAQPINTELITLEKFLNESIYSDVSLANDIIGYQNSNKGKKLRSSLMLLIGKYFDYNFELKEKKEELIRYAASVETLHNATLIHDDIVDDSKERRGLPTIKTKWNNKIAVLFGDFLFASSINFVYQYANLKQLQILANTTLSMSKGELFAMQKQNDIVITEEDYLFIIGSKTATLIEAAAQIAAIIYTNDTEIIDAFSAFGRNIGMGFQIRDDIFDYISDHNNIGKPVGNDIKEKHFTLPLIYALKNSDEKSKNNILDILTKNDTSTEEIDTIIQFVNNFNGIEYATSVAHKYINNALNIISKIEDREITKHLIMLAQFMISRSK